MVEKIDITNENMKDDDELELLLDDPTPKSHMMFRSYNSILPYSCFPKKIDDNLENVATNQINFINSPRSTMFGSDMSPFFGSQQNSSSPRMQIPEYRSEHFNRNVINVRYPAFEAFEASDDRLVIEELQWGIGLLRHLTRVVQKLIETLKTRKQIKMVISALEPGFLSLIKDLNGNHVIQRCLQCLSNEDNK
nr:putative pumilio homolog 8, chloroplastic [Tanacetum cinerariifolium]